MRDKNRIPKILNELERIWKANPDFRLGQLIVVATKPEIPCPPIFYIEDENLLKGLLSFEINEESNVNIESIKDYKKYSNISKISSERLSIELLKELITELKTSNNPMVITPINLMKLNGAPVADQTWLLSQKPRIKIIKKLLVQLREKGILIERKSKQDFKGIKETGYDIV